MTKRTRTAARQALPVLAFSISYLSQPDLQAALLNALVLAVTVLVGGYIVTKHTTRRATAARAARDAASLARCMERMTRYAPTGESAYARDLTASIAA